MDDTTATDWLLPQRPLRLVSQVLLQVGRFMSLPLDTPRTPRTVVRDHADRPTVGQRPSEDVTASPLAAELTDSLESCVCGHLPHSGVECDGGCGCTTFEPDAGRGWVEVRHILKASAIQPQGPYPFGKASY